MDRGSQLIGVGSLPVLIGRKTAAPIGPLLGTLYVTHTTQLKIIKRKVKILRDMIEPHFGWLFNHSSYLDRFFFCRGMPNGYLTALRKI